MPDVVYRDRDPVVFAEPNTEDIPPTPPAPAAATPARDWRRATTEGELYILPGSGHVARLRRPSLMALMVRGVAPNPLSAEVVRMLALGTPDEHESARLDSFKRNAKAYLEIAALAFVSPRLILNREPNPDADEIGPDQVCDSDLMFIYQLAEGLAIETMPFRVVERDDGTPRP